MYYNPMLILRGFQGVLALIAMALGATGKCFKPAGFPLLTKPVANVLNTHFPTSIAVPAGIIFYVFVSVFTLLVAVPFTILTPRYFPVLAHPYAMLFAEGTTCVFWLAGFASAADLLRKSDLCGDGACSSAKGSVVVGVFEL